MGPTQLDRQSLAPVQTQACCPVGHWHSGSVDSPTGNQLPPAAKQPPSSLAAVHWSYLAATVGSPQPESPLDELLLADEALPLAEALLPPLPPGSMTALPPQAVRTMATSSASGRSCRRHTQHIMAHHATFAPRLVNLTDGWRRVARVELASAPAVRCFA